MKLKTIAVKIITIHLVLFTSIFYPLNTSMAQTSHHKEKKKVALALGGGGARGAAHVGVLKVLQKNNLKPDIIVGNSMGSIIGGLYCAGVPIEEIEVLIKNGEVKKAFKPVPVSIQFLKKTVQFFKFWDKQKYPGFYSGESLEAFINEQVDENHKNIENCSPKFAATAVDLVDGNAYRLEKGSLAKALRASSSFPPLLKPVEIEGKVFTDGGIRSNVPTFSAKGMGADYVIAVNVDEKIKKIKPSKLGSYTKLLNRLTSIIIYLRDKELLKQADLVIQPDVSGISLISVDQEDYEKALNAGEKATRAILPELKKIFAQGSN